MLLIHLNCQLVRGQSNSFENNAESFTYKYLEEQFLSNFHNREIAGNYADAFIVKAKLEKDSLRLIQGLYKKIILTEENQVKLSLYDTLIKIATIKENFHFLSVAYYDKGQMFQADYNFEQALDYYLKASSYINESKETIVRDLIQHSIGVLRLRIEDNESAESVFLKLYDKSLKNNYRESKPKLYLLTLYYLTESSRRLENFENAFNYCKLGLEESENLGQTELYDLFGLMDGLLDVEYLGNIEQGLVKMLPTLPRIESSGNIINFAAANQYIGQAYLKKGDYDEALQYFVRVDSIVGNEKLIFPELLESYFFLKNYYSKVSDFKNELIIINKILKFDSVANSNYKVIKNEIQAKFDLPSLLAEKNNAIQELKSVSELRKEKIYYIAAVTFSLLLLIVYQYYTAIKRKRRFNNLIQSSQMKDSFQSVARAVKTNSFDIPEATAQKIIKGIDLFEENQEFLDKNSNAHILTKKIGTNISYFHQVFKTYKNENFSVYLKKLRLNYAFNKLKNDSNFRKYTILAIARESGFKTSEAFSKGFRKQYGFYPSYYIKQLNKPKSLNN